tara:strand:- start:50 stop:748 length:699 start_codon:yes stop_codon:yes gene_type:complete
MQTIEIIGYKRANLGKNESKKLREDGNVPCVVYGGKEQVHFHAPMILFRDLVYTPGANFVKLNIEGEEKDVILQDIQFHPVSEVILHADFLELNDTKKVKMEIPVKIFGDSPGVQQGGKILMRIRKLSVMAYPKNMPEFIEVDISGLELGKSIKVEDLLNEEFDILNSPIVSVVSVNIPRVKIEIEEEEEERCRGEEGAEGAEGATEGGEKKEGGSEGASEGGEKKEENKDS